MKTSIKRNDFPADSNTLKNAETVKKNIYFIYVTTETKEENLLLFVRTGTAVPVFSDTFSFIHRTSNKPFRYLQPICS
jgi:hypothetical protein